MFEIGFMELILLCVVALVVFGPEKLPQVVRKVGLWVGRARTVLNNFKYEVERQALNEEMKERFREQLKEMGLDEQLLDQPAEPPSDSTAAEPDQAPQPQPPGKHDE